MARAHAVTVKRRDERRAARSRVWQGLACACSGHDGADEPVPTIITFTAAAGWWATPIPTVTCARLAHEANALVVSVDYPLGTEAHWRTITDACFEAASAIAADRVAGMLPLHRPVGRQRRRISPPCHLRARDEGNFHIALQALLYPTVAPDFDTRATPSSPPAPASRAPTCSGTGGTAGTIRLTNDYRIAPTRAASAPACPRLRRLRPGATRCATKGARYARQLRGEHRGCA